jgi:hypothetical protein
MYFVIEDHDTLFIISEVVHACGILVLGYKLLNQRNSGGMYLQYEIIIDIMTDSELFGCVQDSHWPARS